MVRGLDRTVTARHISGSCLLAGLASQQLHQCQFCPAKAFACNPHNSVLFGAILQHCLAVAGLCGRQLHGREVLMFVLLQPWATVTRRTSTHGAQLVIMR